MRLFCLGLSLALLAAPVWAQDDEDDELRPGLLANYQSGELTLVRIDDSIAFDWSNAAPDPLLVGGPFTAHWTGQLLVREETTYRFHAFVAGDVHVALDGETVLEGDLASAHWVTGPEISLEFGFRALDVKYRRAGESGRIHLYWSSNRFPLEPLPAGVVFQPEGESAARTAREITIRERGRQQFAALRCAACHRDSAEIDMQPAPSLMHVGAGTDRQWLLDKLQHRHTGAARSRMPTFGFDENQTQALLAFLMSRSQPVELLALPEIKRDPKLPPPDGNVLLHSLGCLACHRVGDVGSESPFAAEDLSDIGARRTTEWIDSQLRDPRHINAHARMPTFELSDVERRQLVESLSALRGDAQAMPQSGTPRTDPNIVAEGRRLYEAAQCAACHRSGGVPDFAPKAPRLARSVSDWDRTCLSTQPDPRHRRPSYPQADREAIVAYVIALVDRGGTVSPSGIVDRGRRIAEQRNCLGCHERGGERGIVTVAGCVAAKIPELNGHSQALIPPNLTAVGDKLFDEPLARSVRGEQQRRMPWLDVRMPKFAHSEADQAALVAYFRQTDRIPDDAPASHAMPDTAGAQLLLAGRTLAGPHGFSCIACHECGDYVPPNVAIATHGSDLLGFAARMRPEFFLRWTRAPLRIVPGIEMPSYERPAPGVLDGTPDTQLAAIWHALSDPDFSMPTNPTAVEQLLIVQPGERTMLIRDVFSVSDACGGGFVPRALAMGFDNGLSVLFDLDTARVREWTLGEFARQRTQGKSWYWDVAGAPLLKSERTGFGLWLELPGHVPQVIPPSAEDGRPIRLTDYSTDGESVMVAYQVTYQTADRPLTLDVVERWGAADGPALLRSIEVRCLQKGRVLCAVPEPQTLEDRGHVWSLEGEQNVVHSPDGGIAYALTPAVPVTGLNTLTLVYESRLKSPPLKSLEIADPPATDDLVTTAPGFVGQRLPITTAIMPTGMAWRPDGTLVFTSLKGHVYLAHDTDGDGLEDQLTVFEEGLAAPFGVLADGDDLLVSHKPELLRLRDTDGDGRCDERTVVADGWGYTHDYHDWTAGPVRDADGNLFLAISSDYSQPNRDRSATRWRGKVLKLDSAGVLSPFAHELRFPMGIAFDAAGRLFCSDQQGVQNCFNEIDHIVQDGRYGVPALADPPGSVDHTQASVQIPHPWTRSVNGIAFLPGTGGRGWIERSEGCPDAIATPLDAFAGHGVGCEYNGRFLVRFSLQEVNGALQGAVYEFTSPTWDNDLDAFLGPICAAVSPDAKLYVGSIFDSGWLGGRNTGEIVKLTPQTSFPNGIREVRAVPGGFEIEFLRPVDRDRARDRANYEISGYTRIWQGSYATPDSDRHTPTICGIEVSDDARTVTLRLDDLRAEHVYEINCRPLTADGAELRPGGATYTLNRVPRE